jgi:GNAT superfamily N-acetyltransferase
LHVKRYNSIPMTRTPTVRIARADDVGALALLRTLWTELTDLDPQFERRMAQWLDGDGERRTTWLATLDGTAVGMASLWEYRRMPRPGRPDSRWGYLSNMFVREGYRDRGIGSTLLDAVISAACERRYARIVLSPSERAVSFYQRAGFVVPDERAGNDRLLVRTLQR